MTRLIAYALAGAVLLPVAFFGVIWLLLGVARGAAWIIVAIVGPISEGAAALIACAAILAVAGAYAGALAGRG